MMDDPVDDAITRWFSFMGILDPSEAEKQVFMFYNSVIPDVEDEATYVSFLASLVDQDDTDRLTNMPALIWFHISLFKAATYEIVEGRNRAAQRLFPEPLDGFHIHSKEFGVDPVVYAKTVVQSEMLVEH